MIRVIKWTLLAIFIFGVFASYQAKPQLEENWTCLHCTFVNISSNYLCGICETSIKPSSKTQWNFSDCITDPNEHTYKDLQLALHAGEEKSVNTLLAHFGEKEKEKLIKYLMKEQFFLHLAARDGQQGIVKLLLNAFAIGKEEKEKLIEYLMKENQYKYTALHLASKNKNKEIVKLLLDAFNEDKEKLIEYVMKENEKKETSLFLAVQKGGEEIVKLLLDVFGQKEKEKKIEYLMKEDVYKYTALHQASYHGHEEIVKYLLIAFSEDEDEELIEYVMKENQTQETALYLTFQKGHEKIIQLLLNAFNEKYKNKYIEYVMKEYISKETVLHYASRNGNEKIVKSLLNGFGKTKNEKLIEYVMKENEYKETSLDLASTGKIVELLFQELANAENQKVLCDLQFVSQMFTYLTKDKKKISVLWSIFGCDGAKNTILSFIITNYNYSEIHIFKDETNMKTNKRKKTDIPEYDDEMQGLQDEVTAKASLFSKNKKKQNNL